MDSGAEPNASKHGNQTNYHCVCVRVCVRGCVRVCVCLIDCECENCMKKRFCSSL